MARTKKRLTRRELKDREKIESLIQSTKTNKKQELINEAKQIQQKQKDESQKRKIIVSGKEVDINSINLTPHSVERAIERMELKRTKPEEVTSFVRKLLLTSDHLGRVASIDGHESEMYINNKYSFHVCPESLCVKTVLKYDKLPYNPAQSKVKSLLHKEFRKLNRCEQAKLKRLKLHKLEVASEIADLELKIFKTKSQSVKLACKGRIAALRQSLTDFENEIERIKTEKRQVAYAVASIM